MIRRHTGDTARQDLPDTPGSPDRRTGRQVASGWSSVVPHTANPRRRSRRLPVLLLLLPLALGLLGAPASTPVVRGDELSDAKAKEAQLKKEIKAQKEAVAKLNSLQSALSSEIASTKAQLREISVDLAAVRRKIDKMETRITEVKAVYDGLVVELGQMSEELERLSGLERTKRIELSDRRAMLADRVRTAYDTDRTSPLETFLSGGGFTDFLAEMSYYIDVGEQDKSLAEQITKDKETLATIHQNVEATRERTDVLAKETAAQKRELDRRLEDLKEARAELKVLEKRTKKALAEQRRTYEQLKRNKANAAKIIRQAAAKQKALAKRIDKLIERQVKRGSIPSQYNGTLAWPMREGTVSGDFGCSSFEWYAPGHGCAHFHNGIDIVAPYGTPVRASAEGVVAYIGWNWADGSDPAWIVVIAHSSSLRTWYAHMKPERPVELGQHVKRGQVIGYEGNTGNSTGAHLHWMVEHNGSFVNPRRYL